VTLVTAISEKLSARSAPAVALTPSSIMKKKKFFPLHEAPLWSQ
jgi:hypothetical protein